MTETRLSVRVDSAVKEKAESVFRDLGLTLSSGVNVYLHRVAREQGIPFALSAVAEPASVAGVERRARVAVEDAKTALEAVGAPVALYDRELKRPYLLYPDGRKDYDL
ncbi:MAG: type II toxin-antitoxin system RelB/DinJ family antitoxin [Bifidobacteriaceae bacterium]|jgi:addiction module RelB/DinJ family antitoxin|nr:type II toxin-antitoxin system RelB/DinJ family antitoxin [Bifidobacteriaceae bacterium]